MYAIIILCNNNIWYRNIHILGMNNLPAYLTPFKKLKTTEENVIKGDTLAKNSITCTSFQEDINMDFDIIYKKTFTKRAMMHVHS